RLRAARIIGVPSSNPEKCAAGAIGSDGIGPPPIPNVPSASKCPSGSTAGVGNEPKPQPALTRTFELVTSTQTAPPQCPRVSTAGSASAVVVNAGAIVVTCCVALFVTETNAQLSDVCAVTCTRSRGAEVTSIGSCA